MNDTRGPAWDASERFVIVRSGDADDGVDPRRLCLLGVLEVDNVVKDGRTLNTGSLYEFRRVAVTGDPDWNLKLFA